MKLRLLVAVVGLVVAAPPSFAAAPRLQVVGNHVVDARSGQSFVMRGVNWPSFEYACHDGYGYSNKTGKRTVGPDAAGAATIVSWHINTVRLPLNQDCWLGQDELPRFGSRTGYRRAVRKWVSVLHRAGLAVVLDLHWSGPSGVVADGQRAMADDQSDDFWLSVARTFRRDRSVVFDLFNEPYSRYGTTGLVFNLTWACWRNGGCNAPRANIGQPLDGNTYVTIGMQQMIDAIRSTGATQPIMVSGRDFGNDLSGWLANRPRDGQLIASFHNYLIQACNTVACWNATVAPIVAQVPVVSGEFGENDCRTAFVDTFMDWADQRGVGYLMWAWSLLPDRSCKRQVLLRDVRGRPRSPNGKALKAHLAALAPRLSLRARGRQALDGAVEVSVRCARPCSISAGGLLRIGKGEVRLVAISARLDAGRRRTLALKIPRAARRAAAAALRSGRRVSARVSVAASAGSMSSHGQLGVRLRQLRARLRS
jgi:endoglucanase